MAVELNGFIPAVKVDIRSTSAFFYSEGSNDNQRGGWWLDQICSMNLLVPEEYRDVTQVQVSLEDISKTIKVQPIIGNESCLVALLPLERIAVEPYRVRILKRAKSIRNKQNFYVMRNAVNF